MDALELQQDGDKPDADSARADIRQSPTVCDEPHCHYCEGPETD